MIGSFDRVGSEKFLKNGTPDGTSGSEAFALDQDLSTTTKHPQVESTIRNWRSDLHPVSEAAIQLRAELFELRRISGKATIEAIAGFPRPSQLGLAVYPVEFFRLLEA